MGRTPIAHRLYEFVEMKRSSSSAIAVATFLALGACYTYRPVAAGPNPRGGDQIQVHLTDAGTAELTRVVGPRVVSLEGSVVKVAPDSGIVLALTSVGSVDGSSQPWEGEAPVGVAAAYIASVERRTFSPGRTALAVGVAAFATVAIAIKALRTGHVDGQGGPPGPPPP